MKDKKIVIDDAVPYAQEIFAHLGNITCIPGREISKATVQDADALIVRSRTQVNSTLLDDSNVKFVGSTVVGLDHVDQAYLSRKGIHFYSAQGCNTNSVAEFIITVLFDLAEAFNFDLSTKTLGIIGVGNVGSRLYDKAEKLGVKCVLNDPPKLQKHPELEQQHNYVSLEECLKADIISVHTPLTTDGEFPTRDLISAERLKNIRPDQIIINAARGGIINEAGWIETTTFANVIDCWENEPYINESLYKKAWIATPHIAGHSLDAKVAGSTMVYTELCKFWNINEQNNWQKALPHTPEIIEIKKANSLQKNLKSLFDQTHNIFNDDRSIRNNDIEIVHKKYENYRRNFPIYREWHQHRVYKTQDQTLNNLLNSLGFKII